jgi:hypothetical protein
MLLLDLQQQQPQQEQEQDKKQVFRVNWRCKYKQAGQIAECLQAALGASLVAVHRVAAELALVRTE